MQTKKACMYMRDWRHWTTCSKYANYVKLNSRHNREDLYDHLWSMGINTLIINNIFM